MIPKINIKLVLVIISVVCIALLVLTILMQKKTPEQTVLPTSVPLPTSIPTPIVLISPTTGPSPTLIPPHFTGADINQTLPASVQQLAEQKTTLRRLAPLSLPFGTISFDYDTDTFAVKLIDETDQTKQLFVSWLAQNYPALPQDEFAFQ